MISGIEAEETSNGERTKMEDEDISEAIQIDGLRGVWMFKGDYFGVIIERGWKLLRIGPFSSIEEAARARDAAAVIEYGSFATLNFPEERE